MAAARFYVHTQSSLALLEKVSVCISKNEPVLLVGETGVGKTATINYLAQLAGMFLLFELMCVIASTPLPSPLSALYHTHTSLCFLSLSSSPPSLSPSLPPLPLSAYICVVLGVKLVVMNMSQQTDSTDLLGG